MYLGNYLFNNDAEDTKTGKGDRDQKALEVNSSREARDRDARTPCRWFDGEKRAGDFNL